CKENRNLKRCHNCLEDFPTHSSGKNHVSFYQHIRACRTSGARPKCANCTPRTDDTSSAGHQTLSMDCQIYRAKVQSISRMTCYDSNRVILLSRRPESISDTGTTQ